MYPQMKNKKACTDCKINSIEIDGIFKAWLVHNNPPDDIPDTCECPVCEVVRKAKNMEGYFDE